MFTYKIFNNIAQDGIDIFGSNDFHIDEINPDSLIIKNGYVEPNLKNAEVEKAYQFEREGYFCRDSEDKKLVFNKTVGLRDTWNQ